MPKAIYITDEDLKDWKFGRRLASLKRHFADNGSTLKRVEIDAEDTIWIYVPQAERR